MDVEVESTRITIPAAPLLRPADADLNRLVEMIDDAKTVTFSGAMAAGTHAMKWLNLQKD